MEEKIIIQGKFIEKSLIARLFGVLAVLSLIISVCINEGTEGYSEYIFFAEAEYAGVAVFFWLAQVFVLLTLFSLIETSFCELVITDKCVYGERGFIKSIDLPNDMISSVGTCFPKGVFVATSSGVIRFWFLANQQEVYKELSNLLIKRQGELKN